MLKLFLNLVFIYGSLLIIFAFTGVALETLNAGTMLMFLTGLFIVMGIKIIPKIASKYKIPYVENIFKGLSIFAFFSTILFMIFIMYRGKEDLPKDKNDTTVIVLGAHVKSYGPTRTLRVRLDKAYDYLIENPDSKCIVTGGQGPDEPTTEAYAMKKYLIEKGIDKERIYEEGYSTNTIENMRYAKIIIEEHNLSEKVVVVSDRFHVGRGKSFAKYAGLEEVYKLPSTTPYLILPEYLFREMMSTVYWHILKGVPLLLLPNIYFN